MKNEKVKINITIALPEAPDKHDDCINRLIIALQGRYGLSKVHLDENSNICAHYDPDVISLSRVEEVIKAEGARLTKQFGHAVFNISPPRHIRHAEVIKGKLQSIKGVLGVRVSGTGIVSLEFDKDLTNELLIKTQIENLIVISSKANTDEECSHEEHEDEHNHAFFGLGERAELMFSIASAASLTIGFIIEMWTNAQFGIPLTCYIFSYFFGGFFTLIEAIENLKNKRFEIDTLMLVAAIGAAILGEWAEGSLLLVLFSLGHALEHYAMGRAKRAIEALAELAPKTAHVYKDNKLVEIELSKIQLEDKVLIRSNERVPVDGYIVNGSSSINQAPVTGESIPVDKVPVKDPNGRIENENRVFTGTINGAGSLEVIVTKLSSESTLARIVKLVSEAQAEASPTEQFTKRIERYFVPAVLLMAILLPFAFLIIDEKFSESLYRAMAVLVAASPCALAISTPSAILSGIARAGRSGVLVKSGAALENLGRLSAMAFDKTGTLTEGRPVVTDLILLNGTNESDLLKITASIERSSDHPLAKAITDYSESRIIGEIPNATEVKSLTGKGIQAKVGDDTVLVAKPSVFMDKFKEVLSVPVEQLRYQGRTLIVVATNDKVLGIFGVMDKPRESSKLALHNLRATDVKKLIMLSGDNQKVAETIAKDIGLTDAYGDLMPDDKVKAIKKLRDEFGMVAMVGDGVNDAPAMAAATVGIAMGAAGSDVALETADIALMTDDLNQLVFSVKMSRQTSRIIKQNLWVSLGVVALLIPATLFGLGIGPAVAMHEGSTLVVVFNALRLLVYKDETVNLA